MTKRGGWKQWAIGLAFAGTVFAPVLTVTAAGAVPQVIAHEGRLFDAASRPLHGVSRVGFRLYAKQTGGAAVWSESVDVEFDDGYFAVWLGEAAPLDPSLLDGETRWLGVTAGGLRESSTRIAVASETHPMFTDDDVADEPPVAAPPEPPAVAPAPDEPRRPAGVVLASAFADAPVGPLVNASEPRFIGAVVGMTLGSAQLAVVAASAVLGSTAPGGAGELQLSICTRRKHSPQLVEARDARRDDLKIAANTRQTFAVKTRIAGLAAGEYEVGLCGHAGPDAGRWNDNGTSRVAVLITSG